MTDNLVTEDALALREATQIANYVWQNHYRKDAPNWQPLPDLRGVISQISNMVTGLTRAADALEPSGDVVERAWNEAIESAAKEAEAWFPANTAAKYTTGGVVQAIRAMKKEVP